MVSGAAHSASTSGGGGGGSEGSPTGRAAPGMQGGGGGGGGATPAASASASTPASETTVARRLDGLDIQGDDAPSSQPATSKKKKRGPGTRATGPDKGGRGLRQFSMKVCEKVESKGRTTYNEVADELVAEFADPNNNFASPDPENPNTPQFDEKNIRRRVYDALNVLMAMDIISKDKKEIQWKGLPRTSMSDVEELKTEIIGLKGRIDKKNAYLQELEDQFVGLQNLAQRNEQLYGSGNAPSGGVALPFILVQTRPHATVEVEISEDMQLVHFDFNSTPFELHDDSFVLKALGFSGKEPDDTQARVGNGEHVFSSQRNIKHHSKLDHGRGHQVAKSNGKGAFEVRRAFQGKNTITKDDVVKLSYLKMVTKESLRMHCPVPLLGPESEKIDTREAPGLVEPKRTSLYLHPVTRVAPSTPVTLMLALAVSVSVLLVVVVVISKLVSYATRPRLNLPPGPWTLPVIGSLHHLVRSPSIHRSMRALAEKHGHLMQIRLGEVFAVVVSSPEAAEQILKSQDITFADRFLSTTIGMITFGGNDLAFAPYGERWRQLRKLCTLELLTAARVRSFRRIREEEVARLVRDLATSAAAGEAVNMSDKMAKLTNDIVVRCCVGGRTKYRDEFLDALRVALDQTTWLTVADVFPSSKLAHMLGTAPRRALAGRKKMEHILEQIIQERKEIMDRSSHGGDGEAVNTNECFVDVLLRLQKDGNTPIPITNEIIVDIFSGGSETSSITLNWTMAELVRKPRVIAKAHVEVRQTFQGKNTITEDDGVNRLTYLKMVIKESLRMHCPVPLLGPRKCREKCKVMDYDIPKNTTILVNAWAICRDPTYWDDAEEFKPERFKNNSIGYKGSNFEFLPFGSGRRMCAGMNLGIANVELPLASLLYYFDWKLPDGMLPEDVDMRDAPGLLVGPRTSLILFPVKDGWRQPSICCNISGGHLYAGNHIVVCGRIGHRISDPARHRVFLVFSVMFFSRVAACCIWWHLLLTLAVSVVFILISKLVYRDTNKPRLNLPPGPWTLPVIGSIHHLMRSPSIHRSMRSLAEKHGPLMQVWLGEVPAVVVSSTEAAEEVLKNHDVRFADRFISTTLGTITFGGNDLAFAPYGERWRQLKMLCTQELLTAARVRSFRRIREEEVARLVQDLAAGDGEVAVNLSEKIARLVNDIMVRCCVGGRSKHRDEFLDALCTALSQTSWLTVADLFPSSKLARMVGTAPRRALASRKKMEHILEQIIQEREEMMDRSGDGGDSEAVPGNECFLDVLLRLQKEGDTPIPITMELIVMLLFDIVSGGTETSTIVLNWTMAELIHTPRVMAKAHAEVRQTFQAKSTITEDDGISGLTYLKMVIKESLRMHCPVPLLGPRRCRETCKVMGYDILKDTTVFVNAWAMCRSSTYWDDAEEFKPERFENKCIDYKGSSFEFVPFGSGRRMCAGMNLGIADVELPLASLLYHFDWKLPDGMLPKDIDMQEAPGLFGGRRTSLIICPITRVAPSDL
uniref:Uncharacterized protein n=1 Tax=Oryza punctata TaxID=4537 RepID=A0A0E0M821_ORYPU